MFAAAVSAGEVAADEVFEPGQKVEVKIPGNWSTATVKERDGDLYLVMYDGKGRDREIFWEWVHISGVRAQGSVKEGPKVPRRVPVGTKGRVAARADARRVFRDVDKLSPAERPAAKAEPKGPWQFFPFTRRWRRRSSGGRRRARRLTRRWAPGRWWTSR